MSGEKSHGSPSSSRSGRELIACNLFLHFQHKKYILNQTAASQNLNYYTYEDDPFDWAIKSNNYLYPIALTGLTNVGSMSLFVVVKMRPTSEDPVANEQFLKEARVYKDLFINFQLIQSNIPEKNKFIFAKVYYECTDAGKEAIVMENVCKRGFIRYLPPLLDLDHLKLAIVTLAKFHAMSIMFSRKDENLYLVMQKKLSVIPSDWDMYRKSVSKTLSLFEGTSHVEFIKKLYLNCEKYRKQHYNRDLVQLNNVKKLVFCHGDMWKKNILYKYDDGKPIEACFVDYQMAGVASPAYDLLYLLMSSTYSKHRRHDYNYILDLYHHSLKDYCTTIDSNYVEFEYTRKFLEEDLKQCASSVLIAILHQRWTALRLEELPATETANATATYRKGLEEIIDDFSFFERKFFVFDIKPIINC